MEAVWDGITRVETPSDTTAAIRLRLADCAKAYDWSGVFELLAEHPQLVNASRPGGTSWYAPLHQAAHGGASADVVERLIAAGAWRGLRNVRGERPVDVAGRMNQTQLVGLLTPLVRINVGLDELTQVQGHFHAVINERARDLVNEHALRLPDLEILLELEEPRFWFAIPGMYGGFSTWLVTSDQGVKLVTESWSRVVGGSGLRHEITADGAVLVDEGFV